jgi:hypothetical protein
MVLLEILDTRPSIAAVRRTPTRVISEKLRLAQAGLFVYLQYV